MAAEDGHTQRVKAALGRTGPIWSSQPHGAPCALAFMDREVLANEVVRLRGENHRLRSGRPNRPPIDSEDPYVLVVRAVLDALSGGYLAPDEASQAIQSLLLVAEQLTTITNMKGNHHGH
jgi:hypothetical protein